MLFEFQGVRALETGALFWLIVQTFRFKGSDPLKSRPY